MSAAPNLGDLVRVRCRHYVAEGVSSEAYGTIVELACLDDDAQGDRLRVVWELEIDGEILTEQAWKGIGAKGFDPPDYFAAFFNTLRWHCVTSTDPRILQSPFRAGIRLDGYQLEPLRKALVLPRVNMFIADDVGLGKTIESGLIASELLLRRRIDSIVVACPPAMLGQWRDEMETRFGLTFEILDRSYYCVYAQRPEDRILNKLVEKSQRIVEELGSLSQILGEELSDKLTKTGIRRASLPAQENEIESATPGGEKTESVVEELEATRERHNELKKRFGVLERQLEQSRRTLHFQSATFRNALSRSLQMAGFPPLKPLDGNGKDRFAFPVEEARNAVDQSWATTLDSLREPPKDGRRNWQWRKQAPVRPITFTPPETIDDTAVQLHLGHRVSQRLLSRFLSQGFRENDLSRACFAQVRDNIPRVVLLGRLGLYGPGASRLHEEILTVTARWAPPDERNGEPLKPYARDAEARTMEILEETMSRFEEVPELPETLRERLLAALEDDISQLRPFLDERGREAREAAAKRLAERARIESEEMIRILEGQRNRVLRTLS